MLIRKYFMSFLLATVLVSQWAINATPLMDAAQSGDVEEVGKLLAEGAKVDEKDEYGETALTRAARYAPPEVVKLLIAKGAAVDEENTRGKTALDYAHRVEDESKRAELIRLLTPPSPRRSKR